MASSSAIPWPQRFKLLLKAAREATRGCEVKVSVRRRSREFKLSHGSRVLLVRPTPDGGVALLFKGEGQGMISDPGPLPHETEAAWCKRLARFMVRLLKG